MASESAPSLVVAGDDGGVKPGLPDGPVIPRTRVGRFLFDPRPSRRASMLVLALLLLFSTGLQLSHVYRYRTLSPIDELQHLDYLIRVPRGQIPGSGDLVLPESGRIETCARIDSPTTEPYLQSCAPDDASVDVGQLQEGGHNTAFIHPPTYYFVDGVLARIVDAAIPGNQSLLTTGRIAGLVWLLAGVVFMWLLLAEVGAGLGARAILILLLVTAPTLVHAWSTINPDGTSIMIGAVLLWAAFRWERGRMPLWVLAALAALATATKVTNLAGFVVVACYLAWPVVGEFRRTRSVAGADARRRVVALGAMLGSVLVVSVAWFIVQKMVQVIPPSEVPMIKNAHVERFPLVGLVQNWKQAVSPLQTPWIPPQFRHSWLLFTTALVDLLVIVGALAGSALARSGARIRRVGVIAVVLMVVLGPALVVFNFFVQGIYSGIPPRYGISLLPALAVASVPVLWRRTGFAIGALVATGASATLLWALAFPIAV